MFGQFRGTCEGIIEIDNIELPLSTFLTLFQNDVMRASEMRDKPTSFHQSIAATSRDCRIMSDSPDG